MSRDIYKIRKEFVFDAGHRVWNQELNIIDGCTFENKCRNIHGHTYKIIVELTNEDLNDYGVVMDFTHVKYYMKPLIDALDHSFIVDKNDPLFEDIKQITEKMNLKLFIVDFVPTAENLAKYVYEYLEAKKIPVSKVICYETPTSVAEYTKS
jgi:6-pyruvoyltetrahydropterin/6-carboxytetrahydropterin synthase